VLTRVPVCDRGIKVLADDSAALQSLAMPWVTLGLAAPWLFFVVLRGAANATLTPTAKR